MAGTTQYFLAGGNSAGGCQHHPSVFRSNWCVAFIAGAFFIHADPIGRQKVVAWTACFGADRSCGNGII